jgi:hypothetical protein
MWLTYNAGQLKLLRFVPTNLIEHPQDGPQGEIQGRIS